jgi:hypothetical protein
MSARLFSQHVHGDLHLNMHMDVIFALSISSFWIQVIGMAGYWMLTCPDMTEKAEVVK